MFGDVLGVLFMSWWCPVLFLWRSKVVSSWYKLTKPVHLSWPQTNETRTLAIGVVCRLLEQVLQMFDHFALCGGSLPAYQSF